MGKALALSSDGNRIVIGGPDYNNFSGIARVFDWDGTSWEQVGGEITGKFASSLMGTSVAISADGQRIALGMPGYKGGFLVFDWNGMSWSQVGDDVRGEYTGINLGISLSMSADGSRIAIGAPTYNGQVNRIGLIQILTGMVQIGSNNLVNLQGKIKVSAQARL